MEGNFREQCVVIFLSSNISISWVYLSVLFRTSYIEIHLRYNNGGRDEIQTYAGAAQWNSVNNSIIGNLSGFRLEKDYWNNYIEQMDFFFQANGIKDGNKKKTILLSSCGSNTYKLFKSLAAPTLLTSTSYEDLKHLMSEHKHPKPN